MKSTKKQTILPIVLMHFQDHSGDIQAKSHPYYFYAMGAIMEEDEGGYYLAHWVDVTKPHKPKADASTYIAKVKGLKIRTIGHLVIE